MLAFSCFLQPAFVLTGRNLGGWSQEGAQPEPGAVRQGGVKKRGESERVKKRRRISGGIEEEEGVK
jgi:hypothetical protein